MMKFSSHHNNHAMKLLKKYEKSITLIMQYILFALMNLKYLQTFLLIESLELIENQWQSALASGKDRV